MENFNIMKKEKGITLIALIITIILLLILAIVTISAVNEGNLFLHANNAATRYQEEAELENTKITEWINKMEQYDTGVEKTLTFEKVAEKYYRYNDGTKDDGCYFLLEDDGTIKFKDIEIGIENEQSGTYTINENNITISIPEITTPGETFTNVKTYMRFSENVGGKKQVEKYLQTWDEFPDGDDTIEVFIAD